MAKPNFSKFKTFGKTPHRFASVIEVNEGQWSGGDVKIDIREWSNDGTPRNGVTLYNEEIPRLIDSLARITSNNNPVKGAEEFAPQNRDGRLAERVIVKIKSEWFEGVEYIDIRIWLTKNNIATRNGIKMRADKVNDLIDILNTVPTERTKY